MNEHCPAWAGIVVMHSEIERFGEFARELELELKVCHIIAMNNETSGVDILILTILMDEYAAAIAALRSAGPEVTLEFKGPDLHQWMGFSIPGKRGSYKVVVGTAGQAGNDHMQVAAKRGLALFHPKALLVVGIAGGLPKDKDPMAAGDVVIGTSVWSVDRGKIGKKGLKARPQSLPGWNLLAPVQGLEVRYPDWSQGLVNADQGLPRIIPGGIAASNYVQTVREHEIMAAIRDATEDSVRAVEMESWGAGISVEDHATETGNAVLLGMIRGLSDLVRPAPKAKKGMVDTGAENSDERNDWTKPAAKNAACLAISLIRHCWPYEPREKSVSDVISNEQRRTSNAGEDLNMLRRVAHEGRLVIGDKKMEDTQLVHSSKISTGPVRMFDSQEGKSHGTDRKLTWLHVSDIHFKASNNWRDSPKRQSLIEEVKNQIDQGRGYPDLILCTGDIAFGAPSRLAMSEQYELAGEFFDSLRAACGPPGSPLAKNRLYMVPGNHDVDQTAVMSMVAEAWRAFGADSHVSQDRVNSLVDGNTSEFQAARKGQEAYRTFVMKYFGSGVTWSEKHDYIHTLKVADLCIAVAGLNSSWLSRDSKDCKKLWIPSQHFVGRLQEVKRSQKPDLVIGMIHHPLDWLAEADKVFAERYLKSECHFLLHGHTHNAWVDQGEDCITVAAGAVGAASSDEFGFNFVELNIDIWSGNVYLFRHEGRGGGWTIAPIKNKAPQGIWPLTRVPRPANRSPRMLTIGNEEPRVDAGMGALRSDNDDNDKMAFKKLTSTVSWIKCAIMELIAVSELNSFIVILGDQIQNWTTFVFDGVVDKLVDYLIQNVASDLIFDSFVAAERIYAIKINASEDDRKNVFKMAVLLGLACVNLAQVEAQRRNVADRVVLIEGACHPVLVTYLEHCNRKSSIMTVCISALNANEVSTVNCIELGNDRPSWSDVDSCVKDCLKAIWHAYRRVCRRLSALSEEMPSLENPEAWRYINRYFKENWASHEYQFLYIRVVEAYQKEQNAVVSGVQNYLKDLNIRLVVPESSDRWFYRKSDDLVDFVTEQFHKHRESCAVV